MRNLRLQHGGAYSSDVGGICNEARRNGDMDNPVFIMTSCGDKNLELLMNLAYSVNKAPGLPAIDCSIYVIGFRNRNGAFIFDDNKFIEIFDDKFPDEPYQKLAGIDGSYRSLGFAGGFGELTIDRSNLEASVANIAGYGGGAFTGENKSSITRLIIASSEAVRSRPVCAQVENCLGGNSQYKPHFHWGVIHNWGGMGLAI